MSSYAGFILFVRRVEIKIILGVEEIAIQA